MSNDSRRTEWNCQIKERLERSEQRKPTNTSASWKLTTSNQWRWKKKLRVSQENLKATQDKTILQKPYQRNKYLSCTPRKIFGTIFEVDQRRTSANGQKNNKTNDLAWGITSQWWYWQSICIKKGGKKRTCQHWRQRWRIDTSTWGLHRKARWRAD